MFRTSHGNGADHGTATSHWIDALIDQGNPQDVSWERLLHGPPIERQLNLPFPTDNQSPVLAHIAALAQEVSTLGRLAPEGAGHV